MNGKHPEEDVMRMLFDMNATTPMSPSQHRLSNRHGNQPSPGGYHSSNSQDSVTNSGYGKLVSPILSDSGADLFQTASPGIKETSYSFLSNLEDIDRQNKSSTSHMDNRQADNRHPPHQDASIADQLFGDRSSQLLQQAQFPRIAARFDRL